MLAKRAKLSHPFGVQPSGNALMAPSTPLSGSSYGWFAMLPHPLILEVLCRLDAKTLAKLAQCSRAMYVFSHANDLWKGLVVKRFNQGFTYFASWKDTYAFNAASEYRTAIVPLTVEGLYSDVLYDPWMMATTPIAPHWQGNNNMEVVSTAISPVEFRQRFELPSRPCKLTQLVATWTALGQWPTKLAQLCADVKLEAFDEYLGSVQLTMQQYLDFASQTSDARPLYIFEPRFVEKLPQLAEHWAVPDMFDQDLMAVLGPTRPDFRSVSSSLLA